MKTVVIYKSKTGYTEKYAKWIAEATNANLFSVQDISVDELNNYDNIVYCGGVYAGKILGLKFIKNNFSKIEDKKIIVVAVGATIPDSEVAKKMANENIPPKMKDKIDFFLFRGGFDYKKMKRFDRLFMSLLVKTLKLNTKSSNASSQELIDSYGKTVDFTDKKSIEPIVDMLI